jgi:hypothetical protein
MPTKEKKNGKSTSKKKSSRQSTGKAFPRSPKRSAVELTHEMIADKAFSFWCQRGQAHGQDLADWLEAETQLRKELAKH